MKKAAFGERLLSERLLSLLFPARCLLCGKVIPAGRFFCGACEKTVPKSPLSRRYDLPGAGAAGLLMAAPLPYAGGFRLTLHRLKFRGKRGLSRPIGRLMAETAESLDRSFDAVVWVPMTKEKERERGYDQSRLLARETAKALGLPCLPLLEKVRETSVQHLLSKGERAKNVKGAFRGSAEAAGKRLLLVDDILTTGATLRECARALYAAGAAEITGLCAAEADAVRNEQ